MDACIRRLMSMVLVAAAAACSRSAPSRFYTLDSVATPITGPAVHEVIMVGPVSVPAAVDRPQIVVQAAANRADVEEFNRWAAPLSDSIARVVAGDLEAQLGTANVVTAPAGSFDPAYKVTINVQRFESIKGQSALVEAAWGVRRTADGVTRTGRTVARENVQNDSFEALAAAYSRALATISAQIAAALRTEIAEVQ
jgi:uncharacterized protein